MSFAAHVGKLLVLTYQKAVSPYLLPSCRFYPSCSSYALEALERYGAVKGGFLFFKRFLRCQPFSAGGFDPLP